MTFFSIGTYSFLAAVLCSTVDAQGKMVKMCLFYPNPSGHARSDPIIDQQCASGHVHTFYGPQEFHPDTTYDDLLNTLPRFSSSPFEENNSLYWHPSIYRVVDNGDGTETFIRADELDTSPYYRWDNSVLPLTEAFPPGFRMIASTADDGAGQGGENGENMFTECCNIGFLGIEDCQSWNRLKFPTQTCDFLGIAFAMPTCWNGDLGIDNDHKDHMAYTDDGSVAGSCPATHQRRLPQIQLFIRVLNYKGGKYQLSDGQTEFHVDFFNGWKEGTLERIIRNCPVPQQEVGEYNPECGCTDPEQGFLTENENIAGTVCDADVRRLVIDEATNTTASLPLGSCQGAPLEDKTWDAVTDGLFETCYRGNAAGDGDGFLDDIPCFAPSMTTFVEGKGLVAMKDLRVGDRAMTSAGTYQKVYAMDHFHAFKPTEFLQIHTTQTKKQQQPPPPLELTPLHMLFLRGKSNPVPAKLLKVGDFVQTMMDPDDSTTVEARRITKIVKVVRNGFFNALTEDGTIVVNGVISSAYPAMSGTEYIEVGKWKIMSHQEWVHLALLPIRTIHRIESFFVSTNLGVSFRRGEEENDSSLCRNDSSEKCYYFFAWYSRFYNIFFRFLENQNDVIRFLIVGLVYSVLRLLSFLSVDSSQHVFGTIVVLLLSFLQLQFVFGGRRRASKTSFD